jgi:hypothetical protein
MTENEILVKNFLHAAPRRYLLQDYANELRRKNRLTANVRKAIEKAGRLRVEYTYIFYIAGTLSRADDTLKSRYETLHQVISHHSGPNPSMYGYAPHLHGTDPVKDADVTPNEVRDIDFIFSSLIADGHFNFLDPRGHGNAIEAAWAENCDVPSIYLVPNGCNLGRLVKGMWNIAGTIEYDDFYIDGLSQVKDFLSGIEGRFAR